MISERSGARNSDYLTSEELVRANKAQRQSESKLRLKARDESQSIMAQMLKLWKGVSSIGFLWPVWADSHESEVLYALNPGYRIYADYYGPYARDALLEWAQAEGRYRLKAEPRAA